MIMMTIMVLIFVTNLVLRIVTVMITSAITRTTLISLSSISQEIVTGIQPNSYEDELIHRRTEIQRDKHGDMLLFPEDDVTVSVCLFLLELLGFSFQK